MKSSKASDSGNGGCAVLVCYSRRKGMGNREQGTGNREQGTGGAKKNPPASPGGIKRNCRIE